METKLEGIAAKARKETDLKFTSLCHHVTRELIWESLCHIPTDSAPGADGITVDEAKEDFGLYGLRRCFDPFTVKDTRLLL